MNGILGMDATWWGGPTTRCMYWCTPAGNITGAAAAAIPPPIHIICTMIVLTSVMSETRGHSYFWREEEDTHLKLELQRLEVLDRLVQHRRLVCLKNSIQEYIRDEITNEMR